MKIMRSGLILVILAAMLCGCSSPAKFKYPPDGVALVEVCSKPLYDKSLAVLPFQDFRGDTNDLSGVWLYFIPLCPFGFVEYERPEKAELFLSIKQFEFEPGRDLAMAAAHSLAKSKLFKEVRFASDGKRVDNADLILEGVVMATYFKGRVFSYGLLCEGAWLWILGAPAGTSLNRLDIAFTLKNRKTGRLLWQYGYDGQDYKTQWIYARYGDDMSIFPHLMADAMNKAVLDLKCKLKLNPDLLK